MIRRLWHKLMGTNPWDNEVKVAVDWWTSQLTVKCKDDAGDRLLNTVIARFGTNPTPPTAEQIESFRAALTRLMNEHIREDGWRVDEPSWGSYSRTLKTDYGPDPILRAALEEAGITKHMDRRLPIKTVMWVNPGSVRVACGYGAAAVDLYSSPTKESL